MISYQGQYELAQSLASDSDATNLVLLKNFITQGQRKLEAILGIYFTEDLRTFTTVTDAIAGTSYQSYKLPENYKKFGALYVTVGSNRYYADLIQDEGLWATLNSTTTNSTSDYVEFCFIRRDRIEFYPIPSSANIATFIYDSFSKPLVNDDYTTGTITTLTNGAMAVTAADSTFTSGMVGRYFRIDSDGEWYKIGAYGSATTLTLDSEYQGVSIAAGTESYTIGQMPITPAETHELPVYYAVWRWALMKKDVQLAREYERAWKEGVLEAQNNWANRDASGIIRNYPQLKRQGRKNPNWYPEDMT